MYKIFMLIAIPALVIAWIAYILWERKMRIEEKKRPKQVSERLKKTRSELTDWAKKMAQFKPPKHEKPPDQDNQSKPP